MKKKVKLELRKYHSNELINGIYQFCEQTNILSSVNEVIEYLTSINFVQPYLVSGNEVLATPEQIGLTYDVEYETISGGELKDIQLWELQEIINNDFTCSVEMVDEFSHPELFQHVGWGDGLPIPRFVNDKIVILKN